LGLHREKGRNEKEKHLNEEKVEDRNEELDSGEDIMT